MADVKSVSDVIHEDHTEHSTRFYWIIGAILAVVTAVEVAVTLIHIPHPILIGVLLVLSVFKGACVVMYYMHMKGDKRPYQLIFLFPFALAVIFVLAMMTVLMSPHVGLAG